jgi:hypothetical protein
MAITTYTELQAAAANWLARSDLTSRIPEFIALCEAKLQRELRARDMETRNEGFTITGEYTAVPNDFIEARSFMLQINPRMALKFMPIETQTDEFTTAAGFGGQGVFASGQSFYCVVGKFFRFAPVPTTNVPATLTYYAKFPPLGALTATNWVLTDHPDAYLYGTLLEAGAFLQDDARLPTWKQGYDMAVSAIKKVGDRGRWGGNAMASRAERVA